MTTETRSKIEALLKTKLPSESVKAFYLRNKKEIKVSPSVLRYHIRNIQDQPKALKVQKAQKVQKVKIGEITGIPSKMEIVIGNITLKPSGNSVIINGNKIEW